MSKITFEPIVETLQPLNIDVSELYDTIFIDLLLGLVLLISVYSVIKKLK